MTDTNDLFRAEYVGFAFKQSTNSVKLTFEIPVEMWATVNTILGAPNVQESNYVAIAKLGNQND